MKKIGILFLVTSVILQGFSQGTWEEQRYDDNLQCISDTNENTTIILGKNFIVVEDNNDELQVQIGNRKLSILESLEGPGISITKYDRQDGWNKDYYEDSRLRGARRFKGHWSGIEFGFNNYNHINRMDLPDEISYMSLQSGKSNSFNINFSQVSLGIFRRLGIVTGLGLNWNNYVFSGNNNIIVGSNGTVEELLPSDNMALKKSKFTTLYLNMPAILELQLPTGEGHRLNIGAGVIGGIKIGSYTKMVYDDKQKFKSRDDLNLNLLRGGVTARIGYQNFMIYGNYYLTPWFKENKGPGFNNLEPFEIGFAFTFND